MAQEWRLKLNHVPLGCYVNDQFKPIGGHASPTNRPIALHEAVVPLAISEGVFADMCQCSYRKVPGVDMHEVPVLRSVTYLPSRV